jgi:hypothetical protein
MHMVRHRGRWTARQTGITERFALLQMCLKITMIRKYWNRMFVVQSGCDTKKLYINMIYKRFSNNFMLESEFISLCQHYVRKTRKTWYQHKPKCYESLGPAILQKENYDTCFYVPQQYWYMFKTLTVMPCQMVVSNISKPSKHQGNYLSVNMPLHSRQLESSIPKTYQ